MRNKPGVIDTHRRMRTDYRSGRSIDRMTATYEVRPSTPRLAA